MSTMVLTKDELIAALANEARILLHLASKVDPAKLDYRPTPRQRSMLELLRYLTFMAPVHIRGVKMQVFNHEEWSAMWQEAEESVKEMTLDGAKAALAALPAGMRELMSDVTDADLRVEIEMFGILKSSRGAMFAQMVLCHFSAYRMQLFQYLKLSGREDLNTMNLWVGTDAAMASTK